LTKIELINKLASLPELIEQAENEVIKANQAIQGAKDILLDHEDTLRLSGAITGKNVEERTAQLRQNTQIERNAIQQADNVASGARAKFNRLLNELAICKAIAGMLKGAE